MDNHHKIKLIIGLIILSIKVNAQTLNKYGHIIFDKKIVNEYSNIDSNTNQDKIKIDGLELTGNCAYKIKNGYLSLTSRYENAVSFIKIFSLNGKEIFSKQFNQIINFQLSESKENCVFYCDGIIHKLNLNTKKLTSISGSTVFSINKFGEIAYFKDSNSTINFGSYSSPINEEVFKVVFNKDKPLFVSKNKIFAFENGTEKVMYSISSGRLFDIEIANNTIYFTTKQELSDKFIFTMYSTTDFNTILELDKKELALKHSYSKVIPTSNNSKFNTLNNELIRDPLNFYSDTVYQPIGNSYCEMQEYSAGSPYLHPGVDLLGTFMDDVHSVKKGYVKAILTISAQYHWRVAIANENTADTSQGYLYAHLEETSIPYQIGDSVEEGDVIGYLVDFPVPGFVHCHFARIYDDGLTWNGSWWTFDDPLVYMTNFYDSIPPTFEKTVLNDPFAFRDSSGTYLSPTNLKGKVKVISKIHDQINANWNCDVYSIRYNLSALANSQQIIFDSLAYEYNFYNDNYFSTNYLMSVINTIYSRDINCFTTADYTIRDFYHIVTNSDGNDTLDGNDSLQFFNTNLFTNGDYIFRVIATDSYGNVSTDSMIISINNTTGLNEEISIVNLNAYPNPFKTTTAINYNLNNSGSLTINVTDISGKTVEIIEENNFKSIGSYSTSFTPKNPGVYFLNILVNNKSKTIKLVATN